ncbi:MAG TPA: hypothetical protein VMO26_29710 [Vicinamibacterales bacterium]|nr:hypothetical protein [Vicinamibacterales bacterium]
MVLFDNNILCLFLHPDAEVPNDPNTGAPIERTAERINHLVEQLQEQRIRIAIPTPVLSEFLTFAEADYLPELTKSTLDDLASLVPTQLTGTATSQAPADNKTDVSSNAPGDEEPPSKSQK